MRRCCLSNMCVCVWGGHMITQAAVAGYDGSRECSRQSVRRRTAGRMDFGNTASTLPDRTKRGFFGHVVLSFRSLSADVAAAVHDGVTEGFIRGSPKTTTQTNPRLRSFANPPGMPRRRRFFCSLFTRLLLFLTAPQRRTFCRKAPDRKIRAGSLQESACL